MTDLKHHYKDVSPEETIQNIKNFFDENGYQIKEQPLHKSEIDTYYIHLLLYKNNIRIAESNGKGMSELYALASGYAELYERFCNGMVFGANPYWNYNLMNYNFKNFGYYFRPDEKPLQRKDYFYSCKRTEAWWRDIFHNVEPLQTNILHYITDDIYVGLPMYNIENEKEILYMDPRMLLRITKSNGMSAGNTLDEAINQAVSEVFERIALRHTLNNLTTETHYAIKLDSIENQELKEKINKMQQLGYTVYIFDLSLTTYLPVILTLIVDKKNGTIGFNCGAFPVFEIALERSITELYQGHLSYKTAEFTSRYQTPYRALIDENSIFRVYGNEIDGSVFPFEFFNTIEEIDSYTPKYFINGNTPLTNQQIKTNLMIRLKTLGKKMYYLNNSLSDKIYAVHVMIDDEVDTDNLNNLPSLDGLDNTLYRTNVLLQKYQTLIDSIKTFSQIDYINFIDLLEYQNRFIRTDVDMLLSGPIGLWNNWLPYATNSDNFEFLYFCLNHNSNGLYMDMNLDYVPDAILNSIIYTRYKSLNLLKQYVRLNRYTNEELLYIFNNVFNFNISMTDIEKINNSTYLLKEIYLYPMINYLQSQDYFEIINSFTKNIHKLYYSHILHD